MSHGRDGVYARGSYEPVGEFEGALALGRQYYDTVGAYFQLVRRAGESKTGGGIDLSQLVEGVCGIAVPVLRGRGGELLSGVRHVSAVRSGGQGAVEVLRELEDVVARAGAVESVGGGFVRSEVVQDSLGTVGSSERSAVVSFEVDGDSGTGVRKCDDGFEGKPAEFAENVGLVFEQAAEAAVVGRQHGKNVRKRARAKAKRLAAASSEEGPAVLGEHVLGSSKAVDGVGYASVLSSGSEVKSGDVVSPVVGVGSEVVSYRDVTSKDERALFARQWFERKRVENELAIQRAKYNVKRNAYLDRARISEKKWEQERLSCEQKLAKITEIRFGSKPGYAETLASLSDGSEKPPSLSTGSDSPAVLSDGTISPDSSMSVAEVKRMERRFEEKLQDLSERLAKVTLENEVFRASTKFTGGRAVLENGRVEVYDGTGQYVLPSEDAESLPMCASEAMEMMGLI